MKFNDLSLFITVSDCGSLTQASVIIGVSQPSLSRQIRDIERKLGHTRLFKRTGRGVELTLAGQRFYSFAKQSLRLYEAARGDIAHLSTTIPTNLNLSVPIHTGHLLIPALYKAFAQEMPDVKVLIDEAQAMRARESLQLGKLELSITYMPPWTGTLLSEQLYTDALYLVANKGIFNTSDDIALSELLHYPLLLTSKNTPLRKLINSTLQAESLNPIVKHELETTDALISFVNDNEGAAILSFSNVFQQHRSGEVCARKIVAPEITRTVALVYGTHTDPRLSATAAKLIKSVLDELAPIVRWTLIHHQKTPKSSSSNRRGSRAKNTL